MKVVFWSAVRGQTGASAGMIAAAFACSVFERKNVFLIRTNCSESGLETVLMSGRSVREELKGVGIGAALRAMRAGTLDCRMLADCAVTLPGSRISFLPGSLSEEVFRQPDESEERELTDQLIELACREYDLVFVEAGIPGKEQPHGGLERQDVEVICLNQNKQVLDRYFDKEEEKENRYYLIGMYRMDSDYTLKNLKKIYPHLQGRTAILPWCTEYQDACSRGEPYRFFMRNAEAGKDEPNYRFIRECKGISSMLTAGREMR
ncbi:MAG: hypothetical protein J6B85_02410 [Lachnospiraceae bacterium]|nr:hypothetical protein [Lachnospiraceae bacterium]